MYLIKIVGYNSSDPFVNAIRYPHAGLCRHHFNDLKFHGS